jgi:hypothetical protein
MHKNPQVQIATTIAYLKLKIKSAGKSARFLDKKGDFSLPGTLATLVFS